MGRAAAECVKDCTCAERTLSLASQHSAAASFGQTAARAQWRTPASSRVSRHGRVPCRVLPSARSHRTSMRCMPLRSDFPPCRGMLVSEDLLSIGPSLRLLECYAPPTAIGIGDGLIWPIMSCMSADPATFRFPYIRTGGSRLAYQQSRRGLPLPLPGLRLQWTVAAGAQGRLRARCAPGWMPASGGAACSATVPVRSPTVPLRMRSAREPVDPSRASRRASAPNESLRPGAK